MTHSAFAPNEAFNNLNNIFIEYSLLDQPNLYVELDLLVKTALPPEREKIKGLLSELFGDRSSRVTAEAVARKNNIPINVSGTSIPELRELLPKTMGIGRHHRFRLENWQGMSDRDVLEVVMSNFVVGLGYSQPINNDWINQLYSFLNFRGDVFEFDSIGVSFPMFMFKREIQDGFSLVEKNLGYFSGSGVGRYLVALIKSIKKPDDLALYHSAEVKESELDFQLHAGFRVLNQLGPPPSSYDTEKDWVDSRGGLFEIDSIPLKEWVSKLDEGVSWLALFVPPAGFNYLDPLVSKSKLKELEGPVLRKLKMLVGEKNCIGELVHYKFNEEYVKTNYSKVLPVLVNVASKIDAGFLSGSYLSHFLSRQELSIDSSEEAIFLLSALSEIRCPPSFSLLVLSSCACLKDMDANFLLKFWSNNCEGGRITMNSLENDLTERLLSLGSDDGIRMAASIQMSNNHLRQETFPRSAGELAKQYCQLLHRCKDVTKRDLSLLFDLEVQIDEVEIWADDRVLEILQVSEFLLNSLPERLLNLVNQCSSEHQRIREAFGPIVEKRNNYAIEISIAVVDAILRLDELVCSPLACDDWQITT